MDGLACGDEWSNTTLRSKSPSLEIRKVFKGGYKVGGSYPLKDVWSQYTTTYMFR